MARGRLPEVLRRLGHDVREELHLHAPDLLSRAERQKGRRPGRATPSPRPPPAGPTWPPIVTSKNTTGLLGFEASTAIATNSHPEAEAARAGGGRLGCDVISCFREEPFYFSKRQISSSCVSQNAPSSWQPWFSFKRCAGGSPQITLPVL